MSTWQADPGELYFSRTGGTFATGIASRVSGKRWFRDTERNDIEDELPGWPPGPGFEMRSKAGGGVRTAGKIAGGAALLGWGVLEMLAGSGSVGGSASGGPVQERENEVKDFPVMWAAPGTLARTLPWQLDPSRCPENYRTHLVVTDRRFLVIGFADGDTARDEVLWETDRTNIASVERRGYSKMGGDAKIQFVDGSWCRLAPKSSSSRWRFFPYLEVPYELVPLENLTEAQRATVEDLQGSQVFADTVVTRRPSGNFLIEVKGEKIGLDYGLITAIRVMDRKGKAVWNPKPGDM